MSLIEPKPTVLNHQPPDLKMTLFLCFQISLTTAIQTVFQISLTSSLVSTTHYFCKFICMLLNYVNLFICC